MDRRLKYFLWVALLILVGLPSCSSEESVVDQKDKDPEKTTVLKIPMTRGTLMEESQIRDGRIIVCRSTGAREVIVNEFKLYPDTSFTVQVPVGPLDIYLIANEESVWSLGTVTTANQLKAIMQNYTTCPTVNATNRVPMFGMFENVIVDPVGNVSKGGAPLDLRSTVPGTVLRIFAKVTLDLDCTFSLLANGGQPIEVKSVSVKRLPTSSYIAPLPIPYPWAETDAGRFFTGTNSYINTYTATTSGFEGHYAFYIPEYIVGDTGRYSYISLVVNLLGSTDAATEREYKIVIGNGIDQVRFPTHDNAYMLGNTRLMSDLIISRNMHYQFIAHLRSYTMTGDQDIFIQPTVVSWDTTTPVDEVDYRDYNLILSQSDIHPATTPFYGVVDVETDYRFGWTATAVDLTGGASCVITSGSVNQPSGQLRFTYTGGTLSSARIKVSTGPGGKITKYITITRP